MPEQKDKPSIEVTNEPIPEKKINKLRSMRSLHQPDSEVHSTLSDSLGGLNEQNDGSLYTVQLTDIILDKNNARRDNKVTPGDILAHLAGEIDLTRRRNTLVFFLAVQELSFSIAKEGLIQPISVSEYNGKFKITAGERRYLAHLLLGMPSIRAIVRSPEKDKVRSVLISLVENTQRENLSYGEMIRAIIHLKDEYENENDIDRLSGEKLTELISKSARSCQIYLQIINGPSHILEKVLDNKLTQNQARAAIDYFNKNGNHPPEKKNKVNLGNAVHQDFLVIRSITDEFNKKGTIKIDTDIDWDDSSEVQTLWVEFFRQMSLEVNSDDNNDSQ